MLMQLINVVYVLVAIAIIAFVLLQQGSGAQAGSGFGGGASATVFGARGASNFLSKSTKWLAIAFFVISMVLAIYASRQANRGPGKADLGVMAQQQAPAKPAVPVAQVPVAPAAAPAAVSAQPAAPVAEEKPANPAQGQ